jgi:hypothetical protein
VASVAASAKAGVRGMSPQVRQLGYAWIIGSVTLGTVALLVLRVRPRVGGVFSQQGQQIAPLPPRTGAAPPYPFIMYPAWARLSILALFAAVLVVLLVLGWRTTRLSWLPDNPRGRLLWTVIVGVAGLAAWFFAATVTFGAGFGPNLQIALGYAGGGLPFALVAAMLLRPLAINLWAAGISAALIVIGFILVAARSPYQPDALLLYFQYIVTVLGGGGQIVPY